MDTKIQVSSIGLITINDTIETKESDFLKDYKYLEEANVVLDEFYCGLCLLLFVVIH